MTLLKVNKSFGIQLVYVFPSYQRQMNSLFSCLFYHEGAEFRRIEITANSSWVFLSVVNLTKILNLQGQKLQTWMECGLRKFQKM